MNVLKWIGWAMAAALVMLTAGCHHSADNAARPLPEMHGEAFPPDSDTRAVLEVNTAQAAAGARQDASLYAVHFDATGLNSLGRRKLDLMLADETPAEPLVVYLDLPADTDAPAAQKNRQSVVAYLKDRGLQDSQISLIDGPNPHVSASAADAITNLHAMESNNQNAQSGTPGNSTPVPQNATSAGNPQPTYSSH
ncbi:MAG TPA: hypothetical protein VGI81_06935 [Tepidisphaeraceae bacterium]|jgi:hypothetical protein